MKKAIILLIGTLALAFGGASVAVAATTNLKDVETLASAESHVVTLLHDYTDTSAWRAEYKVAMAEQNADIVSTNLMPTCSHHAAQRPF